MKKIFSLLLIGLLFISVNLSAQNAAATMKSSLGYTSDTLTNTTATYVELPVVGVYNIMAIQAVVTKISGTVDGTIELLGSNDGTNYERIASDTLDLANQTTNTKIWIVSKTPYYYYRLKGTGIGTMAAQLKGYLLPSPSGGAKHAMLNMKSDIGNVVDTATNAGTTYLQVQLREYYKQVSIQAVVGRISGTAAGTVTLQGSVDGVNYVTVASAYTNEVTYSVTNVALQANLFLITDSPYLYYRLSYTGSGTMACSLKGYCLPSR
jgi:hypothetical protein